MKSLLASKNTEQLSKKKESPELVFKVVLLGGSAPGKTCILCRFKDKNFGMNTFATIGASYTQHAFTFDEQTLILQLWDTAGEERYMALAPMYFRDAYGIILVFSVDDKSSFEDIERWLQVIYDNLVSQKCIMMLVGNKCDLTERREVTKEEAEKFAEAHNLIYIECSALLDINIDFIFHEMAERIFKAMK